MNEILKINVIVRLVISLIIPELRDTDELSILIGDDA